MPCYMTAEPKIRVHSLLPAILTYWVTTEDQSCVYYACLNQQEAVSHAQSISLGLGRGMPAPHVIEVLRQPIDHTKTVFA